MMAKIKAKTEDKPVKNKMKKAKKGQYSDLIPFVGFVRECHNHEYVEMSALNPVTNDRFFVRVHLEGKFYDTAVRCLVHKIPVMFGGSAELRPEGITWIMVIEKPRYFKPTLEVDLKEKVDESDINPKPKRKKTIKLNPRQWNALMQDAIEWIEEDVAGLKERFVAYLDSPVCQFIEGQQNTGMSLLGSIFSLFNTVERAKQVIEAHFENRGVQYDALENHESK